MLLFFILNFKIGRKKNFDDLIIFLPSFKYCALDTHQNLLQIMENDTYLSIIASILNINYKLNVSNMSGRPGGEEARK